MTDIYAYWRAVQAGKPEAELAKLRLPTLGHAVANGEDPQCGLWRATTRKGGPVVLMQVWLADENGRPVNLWREGLTLLGTVAGTPEQPMLLAERWLFARPAAKDEAAFWRQHGRWPADPEPLPARANMPADPFEALKAEADDRLAQVAEWLTLNSPIGTQLDCDKARNMQAGLLDLNKRADAMFEAEKRPHLEAGRAVDRKFEFRKTMTDWSARLRVVFEQFLQAEERRQREAAEAAHRAEVARVEAERRRLEEERAQKLADDPVAALTEPPPELPEPPPAPEPVKVQAGGGVGRKAGLRDDWDWHITDYRLAALHVIEQPDVSAAVGKAIARLVKAGKGKVEIPGVRINKTRRAA